jgi:hypothetical protein
VIAVTSSQAIWYLARGTGAVSLLLLTTVTVLGILNVVRWSPPATPRFVLQRIHRNVSLLAVVFIVIHIVTVVVDGFAPIRWIDAIVPFRSAYRPLWLGLGAVAFDLLIAVIVTSLLRGRLGYRTWRAVHWMAYGLWAVAVFHGLGIGSDSKQLWMLALVVVCVGPSRSPRSACRRRVARWTPTRITMAFGAFPSPSSSAPGSWPVRCSPGGRSAPARRRRCSRIPRPSSRKRHRPRPRRPRSSCPPRRPGRGPPNCVRWRTVSPGS